MKRSARAEVHLRSSEKSSTYYKGEVSPFNGLWRLISSEKRDIALVFVYAAAVGVFSLVVPIAAQSLVNTIAFNSLLQPILVLTAIVFLMLCVAAALRLVQAAIVETIQQRIFAHISLDLAYRLPRLRVEAYDVNKGTDLVNRFFEVLTVQKTAAVLLLDGFAIALQSAMGLVLLAFYHPILLAFDVLLVLGMSIVWLPARRATATSIDQSKAKYAVAAWLEEIVRNPVVFKLSQGNDYALSRADAVTKDYLLSRKSHFRILIQQIGGILFIQAFISALFLGLGSILVIKNQLTLGQLVAAEIVVTMVISGFAKFGKYFETLYDLTASIEKLGNIFELPLETEDGEMNGTQVTGEGLQITLKKLSFKYEKNLAFTFSDVDLNVRSKARLGINGANGSGKSTLFDILLGFRFPTSGAVEISGIDLRVINIQEMRKHIALVRKAEIFDGSIIENIRVGREGISIDDVNRALSQVSLLEEISSLPDGLLTDLTGSLNPLSAGQAQRLMIARALVGNPKLLLLDEALESIDEETKTKILKVLFNPTAPWTLILATRDSQELSYCEEVFSLHEGHLFRSSSVGGISK